MAAQRIGVLGGTFDPVHSGHLSIAERAVTEAALDRVLFIPAGNPRLKQQKPAAAVGHRVEMVKLAVAGNPKFQVCETEATRPGPTYTVDTLEDLSRKFGSSLASPGGLFFILGLDVLPRLGEWKSPERILELCRLVVVTRPGYSGFEWPGFYSSHPAAENQVELVSSISVDISGTELRKRIASDLSLRGLVPEPVEDYIRAHGLYRGVPGAGE
jgi:nicotinate-nucleotide adenylyltransferase